MAMASALTFEDLKSALSALVVTAKGGSVTALRELRAWTELSSRLVTGADSTEDVTWEDMTPQQRATARAAIQRRLAELAVEAEDAHRSTGARGEDALPPRVEPLRAWFP
jgi:hypothetical protein